MKIELGCTTWGGLSGGRLVRRRLQGLRVEAETELPGEHCKLPVCRRCALAGGQWQKQRLIVCAWALRYMADRLEPACEEGIEVPTIGELHNLERRIGNTTPIDLLVFENPRPSEKRGKHGGVTQRGILP